MKRAALSLGAALLALGLGVGAVVWGLQPPEFPAPAARDWIFHDVSLVEAGRAPRPGTTLRIADGRIADVVPSDAESSHRPTRAEDEAPDLAGLYVAPGLMDLHVHYPPEVAIGNAELWSLLLLAHGVTSIRETGSIDGSIFSVRDAIRNGRYPGPRIFACGAMLDGEEPSFPSNRVVTTPAEAREAVRSLAARGADCIKAYNKLSRGALAAIHEAARAAGLPVIGHAPHSVAFEDAGLVDLQHGTGAVLVDVERVGRSDFRPADWETMDDERIAHVARVSLEQGIAHTPTLVNARMRRHLVDENDVTLALARDSGLRHLPRFWAAAWATIWGAPFSREDPKSVSAEEMFRARQARMTVRLHEAGVAVHAGTDTLMPFVAPGSGLHGELEDLEAAGIPTEDVWEIATRGAGRGLGVPGLGTLAVGAPADLIFLREDPSKGLSSFREIEAVLAGGRLYRRADLDAMLAAADAHFHGAFYAGVMGVLTSVAKRQFTPDREAGTSS